LSSAPQLCTTSYNIYHEKAQKCSSGSVVIVGINNGAPQVLPWENILLGNHIILRSHEKNKICISIWFPGFLTEGAKSEK
jgi:hypothetical protein